MATFLRKDKKKYRAEYYLLFPFIILNIEKLGIQH